MNRDNKRAAAEQIGEHDQNEGQPPTTAQDHNPVETTPASTGTDTAPDIGMSADGTVAGGTGVADESAAGKDQGTATDPNDGSAGTSIVLVPVAAITAKSPEGEPQLSLSQGSDEFTVPELTREQKEHHAFILPLQELYNHCVTLAGLADIAYREGMSKLDQAKGIIGQNWPYFQRLHKELNNPGRREKIEGVDSWQEFLVKYFDWCSLSTAKRAIQEIEDEYDQLIGESEDANAAEESEEQHEQSEDTPKDKPIKLSKHDRQRLLKAARIGGKLAEKHQDEPEAKEYLSIANQAPPLFGTDPEASSLPTYEVLGASLHSMAIFIADLYRPGCGSANLHDNIRALKVLAESALKAMGKGYAITPVPRELLQPPQEASCGNIASGQPVENTEQGQVDSAKESKSDGTSPGAATVSAKRNLKDSKDVPSGKPASAAAATAAMEDSKAAPARKVKPKKTETPKAVTPDTKKKPSGTASVQHTATPVTAGGVTVKPGFSCKHNGQDCEVVAVFDGDDPTATLIRLGDGKEVGPVPIEELRFITDPGEMAS